MMCSRYVVGFPEEIEINQRMPELGPFSAWLEFFKSSPHRVCVSAERAACHVSTLSFKSILETGTVDGGQCKSGRRCQSTSGWAVLSPGSIEPENAERVTEFTQLWP